MFKTQLAGMTEGLSQVRARTRRLRAELKDLESQLSELREQLPEEEAAALEREVKTKRREHLRADQLLRGLILSQRKLRASQQVQSKLLTFKVEVLLGSVKWSLLLGSAHR